MDRKDTTKEEPQPAREKEKYQVVNLDRPGKANSQNKKTFFYLNSFYVFAFSLPSLVVFSIFFSEFFFFFQLHFVSSFKFLWSMWMEKGCNYIQKQVTHTHTDIVDGFFYLLLFNCSTTTAQHFIVVFLWTTFLRDGFHLRTV